MTRWLFRKRLNMIDVVGIAVLTVGAQRHWSAADFIAVIAATAIVSVVGERHFA